MQDLAEQVEQSTTDFVETAEHMAKCLQAKAASAGSFADTISTLEAEMRGEHAYDMQDLGVQVERATTDFVEKSEHMAKCLQRRCLGSRTTARREVLGAAMVE